MTTYRTLLSGEIIPPNAEYLSRAGDWRQTQDPGYRHSTRMNYRVPLDEPEPITEMSNQINDGGPAYPYWNNRENTEHGMTLRDYFAGQALAGVLANPILLEMHGSYAMTAEACMNFADAMLTARNQQQPQ